MKKSWWVSRVTVYETLPRLYVVGCDKSSNSFRILKIDRTEPRTLAISEGSREYSKSELNELLAMIHEGNQQTVGYGEKKTGKGVCGGMTERVSNAFGLLGFVRFLEGYYMVLITKATVVAQFGYYTIYRVEDVASVYVPSDSSNLGSEEQRYLRTFQSVDLSTNFYFCYNYNLSRTLQENIQLAGGEYEWKYVWNQYMLEPILDQVSDAWFFPVIHGYVGQTIVSTSSAKLEILLLGRRSNKFAGTRFMKRGASLDGYVANEVETEQIVWELSGPPTFDKGRFLSFVQHRGSVPLIWSQDLASRSSVVVTRPPPIQLDLADPFAQIPAYHFLDLREKYGSPIVVINLVKRRERRSHESLLNDEFRAGISYLNQFLPPHEAILYLSFDVARCNKVGNVLPKLEEIAYNVVRLHGWFQSFLPLYCHELMPSPLMEGVHLDVDVEGGRVLQHGVPRTNCVDCLDRTNVAQFVIGKVALGYHLFALGLLEHPVLSSQTEICHALETLYEEHGDTLALQYAGSQLVHSIKTYKKTAIFQERSRDVIQTISRYYSNTFADYDKQNALNLFLGVYRPAPNVSPLWELTTDFYLHNTKDRPRLDYCEWFERESRRRVPDFVYRPVAVEKEMDEFDLHYRTFELTSLDSLLSKESAFRNITVTTVDTERGGGSSNQLFLRLKKRQSDTGQSQEKNKGKDSKNHGGDWSSEDESGNSDTEVIYSNQWNEESGTVDFVALQRLKQRNRDRALNLGFNLPTLREKYGFELHPPSRADMIKYEHYCKLGGIRPETEDLALLRQLRLRDAEYRDSVVDFPKVNPISFFTHDNTFGCEMPIVSESSLSVYKKAVLCAYEGPRIPSHRDINIYRSYVQGRLRKVKP